MHCTYKIKQWNDKKKSTNIKALCKYGPHTNLLAFLLQQHHKESHLQTDSTVTRQFLFHNWSKINMMCKREALKLRCEIRSIRITLCYSLTGLVKRHGILYVYYQWGKKTVWEILLFVQPPECDPKENAQIKKKIYFFANQVSNICSSFCWEKRLQQEERVEDEKRRHWRMAEGVGCEQTSHFTPPSGSTA